MQTCDNLKLDVISRDIIEGRFQIISKLGEGIEGVTYKVIDNETNKVLALKTSLYNDDEEDIAIGCKLNSLLRHTNSIINLEYYAIIDKTIWLDDWIEGDRYQDGDLHNNLGLILCMPLINKPFSKKWLRTLSEIDIISIMFELCVAIIVLHKHGISHNDLHQQNILINETNIIRIYNINGKEYMIKNKYQPVIIDFGTATFSDKSIPHDGIDWFDLLKKSPIYIDNKKEKTIFDPVFDRLISDSTVPVGSLIKYFEPLTIIDRI